MDKQQVFNHEEKKYYVFIMNHRKWFFYDIKKWSFQFYILIVKSPKLKKIYMWISFLMYNCIAIKSPIAWLFFHRNTPYNQPWITVFSRIFMTKYVPLYLDFCKTFCYYIQRNCHSYFIVNEMHQIFFDRILMYEIPQNAYFW